MFIGITGDIDEESGVGEVIDDICGPAFEYFKGKRYGLSVLGIGVALMCCNQRLRFKRRIYFRRKDKTIYMDIMLDLETMRKSRRKTRKRIILEKLAVEIPETIQKYKFEDFDLQRFVRDWMRWLERTGLANDS